MDNEEKKTGEVVSDIAATDEVKKEDTAEKPESDFSDEGPKIVPPAPTKEELNAKQEAEAKEKIELFKEEDAPAPEAAPAEKKADVKGGKNKAPVTYTYDDKRLADIEESRQGFFKYYKKFNVIKWIVTVVALAIIILGWIIPSVIKVSDGKGGTKNLDSNVSFYITIGVIVFAIAILGVYSFIFKKKVEGATTTYFKKYFDDNDSYVFEGIATDKKGSVSDKLSDKIFNAAGLYKDVFKVGSRNCIHFNYKGQDIVYSDASASVKGVKTTQTAFVGKFLAAPCSYDGEKIVIYLKGNKRALPPTTLNVMDLLEDNKNMVVYGPQNGKKILTKDVRNALSAINTNAILVDLAISIVPGNIYVAFGYEDSLMVLPMDKPFNPAPTIELKKNTAAVFALIDAIDVATSRP